MSLPGVFNLNWNDEASRNRFSFDNFGEHLKIQRAILARHNLNLPLFPIDPIPLFDLLTWARIHQSMHASANGVLKLSGFDLTGVDFRKPEEVVVWTQNHGQEHLALSRALRLS